MQVYGQCGHVDVDGGRECAVDEDLACLLEVLGDLATGQKVEEGRLTSTYCNS